MMKRQMRSRPQRKKKPPLTKTSRPRPPTRENTKTDSRKETRRTAGKKKPQQRTVAIRTVESGIRLNRFLAESRVASRRKSDDLISSGVVAVNGKTVTELGTRIDPSKDTVTVSGAVVSPDPQLVYILLNKPKDCITTVSDERSRKTVMDLVPTNHRLFPVGRLDRNTTGALLLTNDGDLAFRLTHPRFHVEKVYYVVLDRKLLKKDLETLRKGIRLEDGMTAPCKAEVLDPPINLHVGLMLVEGRNRQVRRMFEALHYDVKKLERLEYAGLNVGNLKRSEWRYLEEHEVKRLKKLSQTAEP